MKWILFLTRKYLAERKRRGIGLVWRLAVVGVALGVTTLLLTQTVLSGFEKALHEAILGFNAHLVILKSDEKWDFAREREKWGEEFQAQVQGSTPFLYRESLLVSKGRVKGSVLKGIDPLTFSKVYDVRISPRADLQVVAKIEDLLNSPGEIPPIILGVDLAQDLEIQPGETLKVFLPQKEMGKKIGPQGFRSFRVVGVFSSGLHDFDRGFAFIDLERLREVYGVPGASTGIEFRLKEARQAEAWAKKLSGIFGYGYEVVSWERLNAPLLEALKLERTLFFVIMSMVVVVAAFNIIGVLLLMIMDKSHEISILRAMGSPYRGLKRVFGLQGIWIAGMGCLWGLLLGVGLVMILKYSQILSLAKEVYLVEKIPIALSPTVIGAVLAVTLLISFFATQFAVARLRKTPLEL